jgi:hypothetical protein
MDGEELQEADREEIESILELITSNLDLKDIYET